MARVKVPYLIEKPGKAGSVLYYWQPSKALRDAGFRAQRLPDNRLEALTKVEQLNAELAQWRAGAAPAHAPATVAAGPAPGTVAAAIAIYRASSEFGRLAKKTKRDYEQCLRALADWCGDLPAAAIKPKLTQAYYDKLHSKTPAKAAAIVRVGRILWRVVLREGWSTINPWRDQEGGPRIIGADEQAGKIWSAEAVAAFVRAADTMGLHSIGTAVTLNAWLGQREGDVLAVLRSAYRDGVIRFRQSKTGARVELPLDMVPALAARLDEELARQSARTVMSMTLLVAEATGQPYKEDYFRHQFAKVRAAAAQACPEVATLKFMHLRHTALTRLLEAGCTIPEAAGVTGHELATAEAIAERYLIRSAGLARNAFTKRLDKERKSPGQGNAS